MALQMASFFLISYLIIISHQTDLAPESIDIYSEYVTLEWKNFPIFTCTNGIMESIPLFNCTLPIGYFQSTDKSCLNKQMGDFDETKCSTTTIQTTLSETTTQTTLTKTTIQTALSKTTTQTTLSKTTTQTTLSKTTIQTTLSKTTIQTALSETTIQTALSETTIRLREPTLSQYECPNKNYIGIGCNITNGVCEMSKPCRNGGTCYSGDTLPLEHGCHCPLGYSGDDCDYDERICKDNTCWHNGKCLIMPDDVSIYNRTTFDCNCTSGYDGLHCELVSDMCKNIICENGGICFSSLLSWSCECLDYSLYSGKYCEYKSAQLKFKEAASKTCAIIAIIAIISLFLFVIIMDILKYGFKIDPVDYERCLMRKETWKRRFNKNKNKRQTKIAIRFFYIA